MSDYFAPMAPDPSGQLRLAGGDARLWVKFEKRSRKNPYKSELEGRPIYEPVDYVRIQQPGERDQWVGPATEVHKQRFPAQWKQYEDQCEQTPEGTPVQLLFPNEPHIVELLLDLKIMTMEQLSSLTEQGIDRLGMDGRKYVAKAKSAMERSEALREVTRLEHVVHDQADQIDVLKTGMDRQRIEIEALRRLIEERTVPNMQAILESRAQTALQVGPQGPPMNWPRQSGGENGQGELPPPRPPLVG